MKFGIQRYAPDLKSHLGMINGYEFSLWVLSRIIVKHNANSLSQKKILNFSLPVNYHRRYYQAMILTIKVTVIITIIITIIIKCRGGIRPLVTLCNDQKALTNVKKSSISDAVRVSYTPLKRFIHYIMWWVEVDHAAWILWLELSLFWFLKNSCNSCNICGGAKAQKQQSHCSNSGCWTDVLVTLIGRLCGTDPYSFMKEHVISIEEVSC